jgi:hypothetical protein
MVCAEPASTIVGTLSFKAIGIPQVNELSNSNPWISLEAITRMTELLQLI